jgi:hypothetical protein
LGELSLSLLLLTTGGDDATLHPVRTAKPCPETLLIFDF